MQVRFCGMPGGSEKEAHDYDTHDFSLQNYKASTHCKIIFS